MAMSKERSPVKIWLRICLNAFMKCVFFLTAENAERERRGERRSNGPDSYRNEQTPRHARARDTPLEEGN
jgi:hypothetical protein